MPSSSPLRTLLSVSLVSLLTIPACVIQLSNRNAPADNGGVTGPAANCAEVAPLPTGAPGGDAAPKFVGRFALADPENPADERRLFDWSGNYITVRFQGTSKITVKLALLGAIPSDQLFEFVVDGEASTRQITVKRSASGEPTNEPEEAYEITGLSPNDPHEVIVHKNTEAQKGAIEFRGFDLHGGTLLPPTRRARRIEFIGDSIVCGYGNEGKNATCPFEVQIRETKGPDGEPIPITVPLTENQYKSFTSIAARELDADAATYCWSGKGVYKNYKERILRDPETGAIGPDPDARATMGDLWDERTLASDHEGHAWDWENERPEEIPQVVFISLGTNDFARDTLPANDDPDALPGDNIPDGDLNDPAELEAFHLAYLDLVRKVRERRPDAHVFLATPPMVTDQFPLENARRRLRQVLDRIVAERAAAGDPKVYAMDLVEQGFRYGLGCDYHPNLEVHRIMARQLVGAIRSKTCW